MGNFFETVQESVDMAHFYTHIAVTLHATAYEMATADTDIQNALQQKTFVSLAQAETA